MKMHLPSFALVAVFGAAVPLTGQLAAVGQAPAPKSVSSESHGGGHYPGGWHWLYHMQDHTDRRFARWSLPGGDLEICIDTHQDYADAWNPDHYFELRCDSGLSDRLNFAILGLCASVGRGEGTTLPRDPLHVLQLPPEGDVCDFGFGHPVPDERISRAKQATYLYGRPAGCARAADRVCLAGDYAVAVDYLDSAGNWVRGAPQTKLSESAAVFYFFDPDNAEVLVKLLDACSLTGHRWLYSAPATDLAYRVTVYTPLEGVPHEWTTNAGTRAADTRFTSVWAITDTQAFRCSEEP